MSFDIVWSIASRECASFVMKSGNPSFSHFFLPFEDAEVGAGEAFDDCFEETDVRGTATTEEDDEVVVVYESLEEPLVSYPLSLSEVTV